MARCTLFLTACALALGVMACDSGAPALPPAPPQIGAPAAVTPGPGASALTPGSEAMLGQPQEALLLPLTTPEQAPGTFLYAKEGNIWSLQAGGTPVQVTQFPSGNFPAFPAVAPDGQQVAFTYYEQPEDPKDIGGTDLYVMGVDGSNVRRLVQHDSPGQSLELPFWSVDGGSIWFTTRTQMYEGSRYLGERVQLERYEVADGTRAVVLKEASSASRSADGKALAFIKTDMKTYAQSLWIAGGDGADPRQVVDAQTFSALFAPVFSPDGKRLVFGAVGDPAGRGASAVLEPDRGLLTHVLQFAWLAPPVAEAHGVPWDLWTVNADGSELRRITSIAEDAPVPVWLPDGKRIAFAGERAIYMVDADGENLVRVADEYGSAGLAWLK